MVALTNRSSRAAEAVGRVHRTAKRVRRIDDPRFVKAMSHPLRVRILAMLDERKELTEPAGGLARASLGTVAYHVRTLEQLGLIELVDETRVRGAVEHHYRARERPVVTAEGWARRRRSPSRRPSALRSTSSPTTPGRQPPRAGSTAADAQLRRALYRLDARGFAQLSKACDKLIEQAEKIGRPRPGGSQRIRTMTRSSRLAWADAVDAVRLSAASRPTAASRPRAGRSGRAAARPTADSKRGRSLIARRYARPRRAC